MLRSNPDGIQIFKYTFYGLIIAQLIEVINEIFADRIQKDFMGGVRSGVNGTPTFFINGARHNGSSKYEDLMIALENQ